MMDWQWPMPYFHELSIVSQAEAIETCSTWHLWLSSVYENSYAQYEDDMSMVAVLLKSDSGILPIVTSCLGVAFLQCYR